MTENEKKEILNEHEMSPEEMKTLSGGGATIDWPADCKATVENDNGSLGGCWGTDACFTGSVCYRRDKEKYGCSSTVASTSWCSSSDYCDLDEIRYEFCTGVTTRSECGLDAMRL